MTTTHNIYQDNGYPSRAVYLHRLAEDYGVPLSWVKERADLGPDEDFDGLVSVVNDYSEHLMMHEPIGW